MRENIIMQFIEANCTDKQQNDTKSACEENKSVHKRIFSGIQKECIYPKRTYGFVHALCECGNNFCRGECFQSES